MNDHSKNVAANRGEIARGMLTVAVYSQADQEMPFVREMDERVLTDSHRFLKAVLQHEKFKHGEYNTTFVSAIRNL